MKIKEDIEEIVAMGCDARKDKTRVPNNKTISEEHLTFVACSPNKGYIIHKTLGNKKGSSVSSKMVEVINATKSRKSLKIVHHDGEPANTGWKCKKFSNHMQSSLKNHVVLLKRQ